LSIRERKKRKGIRWCFFILSLVLFVTAFVYYFWFTPLGYRMSVMFHGFRELSPGIYVDKEYEGDTYIILKRINAAKARHSEFWGEVKSNPTIIITDDEKKIARLGGDHNAYTIAVFAVRTYISLSSSWINVDVIAHELTHAETHYRVFHGLISFKRPIPVWFDEGLALQNDTRERYGDTAWIYATDYTRKKVDLDAINGEEFYEGTEKEVLYNYIVSRYEVKKWITENGIEALKTLLEEIRRGGDFNTLYNKNKQE